MVNHVAQPDNGQLTSLLLLPIASSAVATLVAVAAVAAGIAASRFLLPLLLLFAIAAVAAVTAGTNSNPSPDCSESLKNTTNVYQHHHRCIP